MWTARVLARIAAPRQVRGDARGPVGRPPCRHSGEGRNPRQAKGPSLRSSGADFRRNQHRPCGLPWMAAFAAMTLLRSPDRARPRALRCSKTSARGRARSSWRPPCRHSGEGRNPRQAKGPSLRSSGTDFRRNQHRTCGLPWMAAFAAMTLSRSSWGLRAVRRRLQTSPGSMLPVRSIQPGTGRFFSRRNAGLNSFEA